MSRPTLIKLASLATAALLFAAGPALAQRGGHGGGHGGGGHGGFHGGGGHMAHASSFHGGSTWHGGGHATSFRPASTWHGGTAAVRPASTWHGSTVRPATTWHGSNVRPASTWHGTNTWHSGTAWHGTHANFHHDNFHHNNFHHFHDKDFHHHDRFFVGVGFWPWWGWGGGWGWPGYYSGGYYYPNYYPSYAYYPDDSYYPDYSSGYVASPSDYQSLYPPAESAAPNAAVLLNIFVAPNAELWIGDTKMTTTGSERQYVSPPLTPGRQYAYDIRARWTNGNGQVVDQTRHVPVQAGAVVNVDFSMPEKAPLPPATSRSDI